MLSKQGKIICHLLLQCVSRPNTLPLSKNTPRVKFTGKHLHLFLSICMTTKSDVIYYYARDLSQAVISLSLLSASDSDEVQVCYDFEASLWVDAVEELSIDTLVKVFDDAVKNSMHHIIYASQLIISNHFYGEEVSRTNASSPLLIASLNHITQAQQSSEAFKELFSAVSSRMLIFYRDPRHFTILLDSCSDLSMTRASQLSKIMSSSSDQQISLNTVQNCLRNCFIKPSTHNLFEMIVAFSVDRSENFDDFISSFQNKFRHVKCIQTINAITRFILFLIQIFDLSCFRSEPSIAEKIEVLQCLIQSVLTVVVLVSLSQ